MFGGKRNNDYFCRKSKQETQYGKRERRFWLFCCYFSFENGEMARGQNSHILNLFTVHYNNHQKNCLPTYLSIKISGI